MLEGCNKMSLEPSLLQSEKPWLSICPHRILPVTSTQRGGGIYIQPHKIPPSPCNLQTFSLHCTPTFYLHPLAQFTAWIINVCVSSTRNQHFRVGLCSIYLLAVLLRRMVWEIKAQKTLKTLNLQAHTQKWIQGLIWDLGKGFQIWRPEARMWICSFCLNMPS